MSVHEHEDQARLNRGETPLQAALVTVSDTRNADTDHGGDLVRDLLESSGHGLAMRSLVPDDAEQISQAIKAALADPRVEAILLTGGTGISRRDGTVDVLRRMGTIEIEGFGELFRTISHREIGAAAMLSRATAVLLTTSDDRRIPAFAMPGSVHAVQTAMKELIIPILPHAAWEAMR